MGYQKHTSQTALSASLFQDAMVQLTISHPILHPLHPGSNNLPSHIKDKKHFFNCIENLLSPPTGALLVIADVMSLYKNIQHSTLLARTYPLPFIIKNIKKDLIYTCSNLLSQRTPHTETKILPIITPSLDIGKSFIVTINKTWNTIAGDGMLSAIWPSKLLSAYSKSSSIHDHLVHST